MKMYVAKLNKTTLGNLPSHERTLFLSLAHLANEINALQKVVLWSSVSKSQNNAEVSGQVSLNLMFLKLLAGKLKEGHNLLRTKFYGTAISRDYDSALSEETRGALTEINHYFGRSNIVDLVRDNYAFHYSPDEVDAVLPNVPEELEIYFQPEVSANNLYYFAEVLANLALLRSVDAEDVQAAFQRLTTEIVGVTHWFTIVADTLMTEFLKRHIEGIWEGRAVEITFSNLQQFQGIRIPWFTDISGLQEGAA